MTKTGEHYLLTKIEQQLRKPQVGIKYLKFIFTVDFV